MKMFGNTTLIQSSQGWVCSFRAEHSVQKAQHINLGHTLALGWKQLFKSEKENHFLLRYYKS